MITLVARQLPTNLQTHARACVHTHNAKFPAILGLDYYSACKQVDNIDNELLFLQCHKRTDKLGATFIILYLFNFFFYFQIFYFITSEGDSH